MRKSDYIMVVGPNQVYIERNGKLLDTEIKFEDEAHVIRVINRMLHPVGRQVSIDAPAADARLPDGSRVNVVIPPVAVDGPCITIRKFLKGKFSAQEFIKVGSMTPQMAEFLRACVCARMNIIISGNTSSGKTSLLNILSGFIPGHERIAAIEDATELQLQQKYSVSLETKPPNTDGHGAVTTRDLVRNALRMRPDRLIVGEVRTGEALDMLQAMNTGHDGSMTTLHANSPRDAIARLETIALMGGVDIPLLAVRNQIANAIDLIIHMDRLTDGSRKIVNILSTVTNKHFQCKPNARGGLPNPPHSAGFANPAGAIWTLSKWYFMTAGSISPKCRVTKAIWLRWWISSASNNRVLGPTERSWVVSAQLGCGPHLRPVWRWPAKSWVPISSGREQSPLKEAGADDKPQAHPISRSLFNRNHTQSILLYLAVVPACESEQAGFLCNLEL